MKKLSFLLTAILFGFSFNINSVMADEEYTTVTPDVSTSPSTTTRNEKEEIKKLMLKLGLENIEITKIEDNTLGKDNYSISYENRTLLHEIHLIGALLSGLKGIVKDNSYIEIYPQSNGKVLAKISLNYNDFLEFKNKNITEDDFSKKINIVQSPVYEFKRERTNNMLFHSDLVIAPSYVIDGTNGPTILFSPYINMYFDKGFSFNTRYRVPVYNVVNGFDFTKNSQILSPSFGYTNVDYGSPILNLPFYSTLRLGYIYEYQSSNVILSNDLQYMLFGGLINLNMSTGVNYNITKGNADFSITPYGQIYLGKLDLILEGGAGKFLYGEYGLWGRATRQFDNVDLGFSLYKTFGQSQSGFRLNFEYNIAIGPEHSIDASIVRVTYPRFFSGSFTAGQNTGFSVAKFKTDDFVKRLYPEYIKTHLYYWLND